ncbi:hypothetical protein [Kaarinaea lacus]
MNKKLIYCFALIFPISVVQANGTQQITEQDIVRKSVQELHSLQSELKNAIDVEIGQAKCRDDGQCKTLAIGANPCGGPESYQVYSTLNTDIEQLKELAEQYKSVRKTLHTKTGTLGACIVIPEPTVQCKNQQCIAIKKPNVLVF